MDMYEQDGVINFLVGVIVNKDKTYCAYLILFFGWGITLDLVISDFVDHYPHS
jgi:hypothetical protein